MAKKTIVLALALVPAATALNASGITNTLVHSPFVKFLALFTLFFAICYFALGKMFKFGEGQGIEKGPLLGICAALAVLMAGGIMMLNINVAEIVLYAKSLIFLLLALLLYGIFKAAGINTKAGWDSSKKWYSNIGANLIPVLLALILALVLMNFLVFFLCNSVVQPFHQSCNSAYFNNIGSFMGGVNYGGSGFGGSSGSIAFGGSGGVKGGFTNLVNSWRGGVPSVPAYTPSPNRATAYYADVAGSNYATKADLAALRADLEKESTQQAMRDHPCDFNDKIQELKGIGVDYEEWGTAAKWACRVDSYADKHPVTTFVPLGLGSFLLTTLTIMFWARLKTRAHKTASAVGKAAKGVAGIPGATGRAIAGRSSTNIENEFQKRKKHLQQAEIEAPVEAFNEMYHARRSGKAIQKQLEDDQKALEKAIQENMEYTGRAWRKR